MVDTKRDDYLRTLANKARIVQATALWMLGQNRETKYMKYRGSVNYPNLIDPCCNFNGHSDGKPYVEGELIRHFKEFKYIIMEIGGCWLYDNADSRMIAALKICSHFISDLEM